MLVKERLKYPILLFLLILFAKIVYIAIESSYNYDILQLATSSDFSREKLEMLNARGHLIASAGFTLFAIPLLYFFTRYNKLYRWLSLSIYASITFVAFYFSLGALVDMVVAQNQDKRYQAYYTNLVKYGMLNNVISYDSFVDPSHLYVLDIEDRILITNIFMLLYADQNLINKFREKGEANVIKLVIKKFKTDGYRDRYQQLKKLAKEIEKLWIGFNDKREMLLQSIHKLSDEKEINRAYEKMKNKLKENYVAYKKAYYSIDKSIQEHTTLRQLNKTKKNLQKYFRYKRYKKAQKQYRQKMFEKFGHYVEPKRWLDNKGQVTYSSIENVIKEEIVSKVRTQTDGLKSGLSFSEFVSDIRVKSKVADELRQHHILIPKNFNYSYADFRKYYTVMTAKESKKMTQHFYQELEKRIGKNDLKLTMDWKEFVYSDFMSKKLTDQGIKNPKPIQEILESQDLGNFSKKIYLPKAYAEARKKLIYTQEQFYSDRKVAKMGDEAIKLLYIPPIALGLSILALMLNLLTVLGMLFRLFGARSYVSYIVTISAIITIVLIPFLASEKKLENTAIKKVEKLYLIKSLQWSSFWVKVNYWMHDRLQELD